MKKNVTYVGCWKLELICAEYGATMLPQSGFIKVAGAKGRQLYIAKTKNVGRVDLSGFLFDGPGVINLGDASFGAVKQQLDFSRDEDDILTSFRSILDYMLTLPAVGPVETFAAKAKAKAKVKTKVKAKADTEPKAPKPAGRMQALVDAHRRREESIAVDLRVAAALIAATVPDADEPELPGEAFLEALKAAELHAAVVTAEESAPSL